MHTYTLVHPLLLIGDFSIYIDTWPMVTWKHLEYCETPFRK